MKIIFLKKKKKKEETERSYSCISSFCTSDLELDLE